MARTDLNVRLGVITKDFEKSLKKAERSLRRTAQQFSDIGSSLTQTLTLPIAGVGIASIKAAGDIEALEKGLEAVLPAGEDARQELERLRKIAELPGLGFEQAIRGSVRLQAVGFNAAQARESLEAFGRVVAVTGGTAEELDSVVRQITQINAKGRILAEDLNIIQENAPAVSIALNDAFGTTNVEAIRATGISAAEFTSRLVQAVQESEKFQKVNGGLKNALENVRISVRLFLADLGAQINQLFDVQGIAERFSATLGRLSAAFKELTPEQKRSVIQFAAVAAAIGPVLIVTGKLLTVFRLIPIALGGILTPLSALASGLLIVGRNIVTAVKAGRGLLAVTTALNGTLLGTVAPIVGVIAAITAIAGAFLFVRRNSEAFSDFFTNIWIGIKNSVIGIINGLIDGIAPILEFLGVEIEKAKIEPGDFVEQREFESFGEFMSGVKSDLQEIVPGLNNAAAGFRKLKSAVFGGEEAQQATTETATGAFDDISNLNAIATPVAGSGSAQRQSRETVEALPSIGTIAPPESIESLQKASEATRQLGDNVRAYKVAIEETQSLQEVFRERVLEIGNAIRDGLNQAFQSFFTTLIEGGRDAFGKFLNVLKDIVKQIIAQLLSAIATAATLAAILSLVGGGSFGSIFKGILGGANPFSFIPGLADGGIVPGGFPNDTFLARLSSGEAVIPLDRLNNMLNTERQPMIAETVIRGSDIVLSYDRASKNLAR